jgi:hypothetical protein
MKSLKFKEDELPDIRDEPLISIKTSKIDEEADETEMAHEASSDGTPVKRQSEDSKKQSPPSSQPNVSGKPKIYSLTQSLLSANKNLHPPNLITPTTPSLLTPTPTASTYMLTPSSTHTNVNWPQVQSKIDDLTE